jgi:hypothetical protein
MADSAVAHTGSELSLGEVIGCLGTCSSPGRVACSLESLTRTDIGPMFRAGVR